MGFLEALKFCITSSGFNFKLADVLGATFPEGCLGCSVALLALLC